MKRLIQRALVLIPAVRRYVERNRKTVNDLNAIRRENEILRAHAADLTRLTEGQQRLTEGQQRLTNELKRTTDESAARFRLVELWYRDLMTGMRKLDAFGELPRFELESEHRIAAGSDDHIHPWGTAVDNTRWPRFVGACERALERRPLRAMDLGCSGGGMVLDFVLAGHHAVGVEGSDYSLVNRRAEWRTLPDHLFTADITQPFTLSEAGKAEPVAFDVITAWDVLEHLAEGDLEHLFGNICRHLRNEGLFIGTIAVVPDRDEKTGAEYHRTVRPRDWWVQRFADAGLAILTDHPFEHDDFCRGIGNPNNPNDADYRKLPDLGFHFVAKRR